MLFSAPPWYHVLNRANTRGPEMSQSYHIVDSHVHSYEGLSLGDNFAKLMNAAGLDAVSVAALPAGLREKYSCFETACATLAAKLKAPSRFYCFASLLYRRGPDGAWVPDFKEQAEAALAAGADGFKMLEGKPDIRKASGVPLDSKIYDPFYSLLESRGVPLLLHVADPEEFWDKAKAPEWAVKHGWFWGDGSFQSKEALYAEVDGLLKKHPALKLTLAHFYFLSADMERARGFLAEHPNVCFDITPGTEMYFNFSKRPVEWRKFFTEHSGRIIFGSDCTDDATAFEYYRDKRLGNIRRFLETDDDFDWGRGIKLDPDTLAKIYSANFTGRLVGGASNPVDPKALLKLWEKTMPFAGKESKQKLEEIAPLLQ